MSGEKMAIRVVIYPQGPFWLAQALEYDLTAQGRTINESVARLIGIIAETYRYTLTEFGTAFEGVDEAPERFHKMFREAEGVDFDVSLELPDVAPQPSIAPHIAARFLQENRAAQ